MTYTIMCHLFIRKLGYKGVKCKFKTMLTPYLVILTFRLFLSSVIILLVGNKNDCPEKKVVQTDDAQKFADQIGIQLYETSAKENLNVEEVS